MEYVKYLFLLGAAIMGGSIVYGFAAGDFWHEGNTIIEVLWGKITLIDIYLSFLTFSAWVFFREGWNGKSVCIFLFILFLGSFTICLYTFIIMHQAKGNWRMFWFGKRIA